LYHISFLTTQIPVFSFFVSYALCKWLQLKAPSTSVTETCLLPLHNWGDEISKENNISTTINKKKKKKKQTVI